MATPVIKQIEHDLKAMFEYSLIVSVALLLSGERLVPKHDKTSKP